MDWHDEYVIDNVLDMYEWGKVTKIIVSQGQGESVRLDWRIEGRPVVKTRAAIDLNSIFDPGQEVRNG